MNPVGSDIGIDDKRVFDDRREPTIVWIASDLGVTRAAVAGRTVGRFSLALECVARDVVLVGDRLFVATPNAVLRGSDAGFEQTGLGSAVALGSLDATPLAASPDGTISAFSAGGWRAVGAVPGEVHRMDGTLLAAGGGVYRVGTDVVHQGLDDARDVAVCGSYAATGSGLYVRQNGWRSVLAGDASVVAADDDRVHAVVDGQLRARREETWVSCELPTQGSVVDVGHGEQTFALTEAGTLLVTESGSDEAPSSWRARELGLVDARSVAVARPPAVGT